MSGLDGDTRFRGRKAGSRESQRRGIHSCAVADLKILRKRVPYEAEWAGIFRSRQRKVATADPHTREANDDPKHTAAIAWSVDQPQITPASTISRAADSSGARFM